MFTAYTADLCYGPSACQQYLALLYVRECQIITLCVYYICQTYVGIYSVIWSPHLKCDIERIEKVQRQFTKRLYGFKHLYYEERLTKLGIPSLELRRLYLDLTYTVIKLYLDLSLWTWPIFFEFSQFTGTRGHAYKLYKPRILSEWISSSTESLMHGIIYPLLSVLLV